VRCILEGMRSLEVHVFETDRDLDLALNAGIILPEQVARTACVECGDAICYSGRVEEFCPFVLIIDENDQDWALCEECASPIVDYVDAFFPPVVKSHFFSSDSDDLEYF
jgi:hypothetical protein